MFEIAYTQHRGKQNPHQQDAIWNGIHAIQGSDIPSSAYTHSGESLWLAVADGIAVSHRPDIASLFIVKALGAMSRLGMPLNSRLVREIHGLLCDQHAKGRTWGSSATLVAARYIDNACEIANVGDSRAYRIAANGEWTQLSHDHTILNDMIANGEAEPEKEYAHLYQGLAHYLMADHEESQFAVHCRQTPFLPGDSLLLCSDGLHDTLGDTCLRGLHSTLASPLEQVEAWRKAVMAAGAPDNFSIILARRLPKREL